MHHFFFVIQLIWWNRVILKKPYAFLIKRFRIIHLILSFLIGFVIYRTTLIIRFFMDYVKNNYNSNIILGLGETYAPSYLFIILLIIILLSGAIYYLLRHKNKPTRVYLCMIIYYIISFVILIYIKSVLGSLVEELISARLSRSIRDLSMIYIIPQIIFFIISIIRTVGFDIKKFNFQSDLKEMHYGFEDSEEVEVNINLNSYKYKRKFRRSMREFGYYIKENKLFVIIFLSIVAVALVVSGIKNRHVNYDQSYRTGREFTYNGLNIAILDTMVTNLDYHGNILNKGYYYVVLKVHLVNNTGYTRSIDFNQFNLTYGDKIIKPTLSDSSYFIDFASENVISSFTHKTDKTFALVYKIDEKDAHKGYKLDIYNGTVITNKESVTKHIYVSLKTKFINDLKLNGNYKLGEKVTFEDTYLANSYLKVDQYEINKTYFYTYEKCYKDSCNIYDDAIAAKNDSKRLGNYILTLHIDYFIDDTSNYGISNSLISSFAENFVQIQYKVGDKVYSDEYYNVTPTYNTKFLAFEVNKDIKNASIIQAIVIIRNQKYIINLKSWHVKKNIIQ